MKWFLDVDGVINAMAKHYIRAQAHYPEGAWRQKTVWPAKSLQGIRIIYDLKVIDFLWEMHRAEVEITWLTTWVSEANTVLGKQLLLPEFPVLGTSEDAARSYREGVSWRWKLPIAQEAAKDEPFIWTDDELVARPVQEWLSGRNALSIAPDEKRGLTHKNLDEIRKFAGL